jgi:phosphotransferase system enzyme I (PtsI)
MTSRPNEREFVGQPAAPGIAVGIACWLAEETHSNAREKGAPTAERELLARAVAAASTELTHLSEASDDLGHDILEFQIALLEDDDLLDRVRAAIGEGLSAEDAWERVLDEEIAEFGQADSEAMASRADDLRDLRDRVLGAMGGHAHARREFPEGAILFAHDISPSRFLGLDWTRIGAAVIAGGSVTSHVSILARARGVPMIVDVMPEPDAAEGEAVAVDASAGRVVASPGDITLSAFARRRRNEVELEARAAKLAARPAVTAAGKQIRVLVNVNHPDELSQLDPTFCDGIGLTRTEFLFQKGAPGEEEQFAVYSAILRWASARPVTIRTLDAGGDKPMAGITRDGEANPFLGLRGLRLSLRRPEIFRVQLRALLRAAALGPMKIMVPMVTLPQELAAARHLAEEVAVELRAQRQAYALPPLGMMVEVPAAALTAADFDADFYSIGSNDLTQYVMAVARDATGLSHLSRGDHPAVIELIRRTVEAGRARGVEVSLCGDLASRPDSIGALLATGLDTLSVAPASIGRVKLEIAAFPGAGA